MDDQNGGGGVSGDSLYREEDVDVVEPVEVLDEDLGNCDAEIIKNY